MLVTNYTIFTILVDLAYTMVIYITDGWGVNPVGHSCVAQQYNYQAQNKTNYMECVYGIILKVNRVSTERYVFMVLLCLLSSKENQLYSTCLWYYFVC